MFRQDLMANESPGCAFYAPLALGTNVYTPMLGFLHGFWASELISLSGTLFTESSPLPLDDKAFEAMTGLGFVGWKPEFIDGSGAERWQ